jgi:hypothetical protein
MNCWVNCLYWLLNTKYTHTSSVVLGAVAGGMTIEDAYSAYFSSYIVPWKTADNAFVEVPISTLVDVQQEALNNISTIWAEFG